MKNKCKMYKGDIYCTNCKHEFEKDVPFGIEVYIFVKDDLCPSCGTRNLTHGV